MVAQVSRQFDPTPSEIESWVDEVKRGVENALRAKPEDVRERYECQLKDLQETYDRTIRCVQCNCNETSYSHRVSSLT